MKATYNQVNFSTVNIGITYAYHTCFSLTLVQLTEIHTY
jgi:hypothetical protein